MAFAPETAVESVRWDLDELYASGDDPRIEADLTEAQRFAEDFEARYRGRLGQLAPAEFLAMMTALEAALEMGSRPAIYAQLKYSQDTGDEAAGRLLGRIRDAGARRGRHLVFFSLELAALDDGAVERLAAAPETSRYRHLLERERSHRPHQLSEVGRHLVFFSLELAALDDGAVERLAAAPETSRYRHLLERERSHRPHQLS